MKWLWILLAVLSLSACAGLNSEQLRTESELATAQVGVVNHTGNYIYSARPVRPAGARRQPRLHQETLGNRQPVRH